MSTQRTPEFRLYPLFLSARILSTSSAVILVTMSHFEHTKCKRPSAILDVYLGITILLDIVHNRTLWLSVSSNLDSKFVRIHTTTVACKAVLAILESRSKRKLFIRQNQTTQSLDGTCGIYSMCTFSWLNRLVVLGYQNPLQLDMLPVLDEAMAVEDLHAKFLENMKGYLGNPFENDQKNRILLSKALGKTLLLPLLLPIIPRLLLVEHETSQDIWIGCYSRPEDTKSKSR
jgi:ATP-binding cassette subfamily C (CFTR/MRP) protein 1